MLEMFLYIPILGFWGLIACITLAACIRIVTDIYNYLGLLLGSYDRLEDKEGREYLRKIQ